jgi:rhodanese-related sulfurtransferase
MIRIAGLLFFTASIATGQTKDPAFSHMLNQKLAHSVAEIDVADLRLDEYYFLDCRERAEYEVSHIPDAIFIGSNPSKEALQQLPSDKPWVFYCSVGVRSEKVAESVQEQDIISYNLVGGIFEWVNRGRPIEDAAGIATKKVHPYNRVWGVWLKAGTKSFE